MSKGGSKKNNPLEALQAEVLEEEIRERDRLQEDLEARRRLRLLGGRQRQLRFTGPGRIARANQQSERQAPTAATPAQPPTTLTPGRSSGSSRDFGQRSSRANRDFGGRGTGDRGGHGQAGQAADAPEGF